jgi:hypothetical protein
LRAGLLSERDVIKLVNENFVSTWVLINDLKSYEGPQAQLAGTLSGHWEYPLDLMFLNVDGRFVTKLNSFQDFPAHRDVGHPRHDTFSPFGPSHADIFLEHAREFLGHD